MTRTDSPEPKFRRRAEKRPDELLDAALALFVSKGYSHTSVAEIARAAGVSKGAVYLYFPSKQAILEGLVRRAVTPVAARVFTRVDLAGGDMRAILSTVLHGIAEGLADAQTFAVPKIVIREAVVAPEIAEMYRRAVFDSVLPAGIRLIETAIASGQMRPVDPELTLRSVMGPMVLHIMLSEVFSIRPKDGLAIDRLVDNHLDILLNGLFTRETESRTDV